MYQYALLDPRPIPAAAEANEVIFHQGPVLGIEVTVPALAAHCTLGNIDPQHTGGHVERAAIEDALTWPLPPAGTVLVTVRADLDALGSMAVLAMRAAGETLGPAVAERVRRVAVADRFARGPWPGSRPLLSGQDGDDSDEAGGGLALIGAAVRDSCLPVPARVRLVHEWLRTGEAPAEYHERVTRARAELRAALASGAIRFETRADGRLAVVEGAHHASLFLAYRLAPVVVARNPEFRFQGGAPHVKLTVAQYTEGHADLVAVCETLAEREPGWGGSPTIIGSPQGIGSVLSLEDVIEVVERHLCGRGGRPGLQDRAGGSPDSQDVIPVLEGPS